MGAYLSEPITEKISTDHEGVNLKCGASSMQGWRMSQEDAHNCELDFDKGSALFAVYDGHGGHEVAEYSARHLPEFIKQTDAYKASNFEEGLVDAFIGFDATLATEPVMARLKEIAKSMGGNKTTSHADEEEEEEEEVSVSQLYEEANMPLVELMAKYQKEGIFKEAEGKKAVGLPALRRLCGEGSGSKAPVSPFLRPRRITPITLAGSSSSAQQRATACDGEVSSSNSADCAVGNTASSGEGDDCTLNSNGEVNGEMEVKEEGADSTEDLLNGGDESVTSSSPRQGGEKIAKNTKEEETDSPVTTTSTEEITSSLDGRKKSAAMKVLSSLLVDAATAALVGKTAAGPDDNEEDGSDEDDDDEDESEEDLDDEEDGEEAEEEEDSVDDDEDDEDDDKVAEEPGMESGCTAVVALVRDGTVYVANAGDSRAVLCRAGQAVDMSLDHKPEDQPERERIVAAGGEVTMDGRVNGGLNLSRALGDHSYKQNEAKPATEQMITALPDVRVEKLGPEDEFLVLACDGIWNFMSSQEVVDFVRPRLSTAHKLSSVCEELFDHCLAPNTLGDGTGCDNMTCVIVQLSPLISGKRVASPSASGDAKRSRMDDSKEAMPAQ